jgi:hypothetical protein
MRRATSEAVTFARRRVRRSAAPVIDWRGSMGSMEPPTAARVVGTHSIPDALGRWYDDAPDDALLLTWRAIVEAGSRVQAPPIHAAAGWIVADGQAVPLEGPTVPYERSADLLYSGFPDRGSAFRSVGGALRFELDGGARHADRDDAARAGAPAGELLELVPSRRQAGSRKRHGTAALRRALYVRGLMLAGLTHDAALREWVALSADPAGVAALDALGPLWEIWHPYERSMAAAHRRVWRKLGII